MNAYLKVIAMAAFACLLLFFVNRAYNDMVQKKERAKIEALIKGDANYTKVRVATASTRQNAVLGEVQSIEIRTKLYTQLDEIGARWALRGVNISIDGSGK